MSGLLKAFADWLRTYDSIAVWLEGIALVLILGLDWRERIDQRKERREQHRETAEQLAVSNSQVAAAMNSADAAMTSAQAAKLSADIAAALHRPLIGLEIKPISSLTVNAFWITPVTLQNYGTLPATHLSASFEFHTESPQESRFPVQTIDGPQSAEIFPGSSYVKDLLPSLSQPLQKQVIERSKDLILTTKVKYRSPDGREFEYTAEARLDTTNGRFALIKSQTRIL